MKLFSGNHLHRFSARAWCFLIKVDGHYAVTAARSRKTVDNELISLCSNAWSLDGLLLHICIPFKETGYSACKRVLLYKDVPDSLFKLKDNYKSTALVIRLSSILSDQKLFCYHDLLGLLDRLCNFAINLPTVLPKWKSSQFMTVEFRMLVLIFLIWCNYSRGRHSYIDPALCRQMSLDEVTTCSAFGVDAVNRQINPIAYIVMMSLLLFYEY